MKTKLQEMETLVNRDDLRIIITTKTKKYIANYWEKVFKNAIVIEKR